MSKLVNSITSPVGVKLFSGGPYSDSGHLDQAQKAQETGNSQISNLIAQLSQMTGVQNPQSPGGGTAATDPFSLNPVQQQELNNQNSLSSESYNKILARVKSNLAARGLGDSSSMAAAEAHLKGLSANQVGQNSMMAGQNAYNSRLNSIGTIGNLVNGQTAGNVGLQQQQAQQSTQEHNNSMGQLGGLLGFATGGGVGSLGGKAQQPLTRPNLGGTPVQSGNSGPAGGTTYGDLPVNWGSIYQF